LSKRIEISLPSTCIFLFFAINQIYGKCMLTPGGFYEYNVLGLCEEAELEVQMFNLAQKFIRIPNVQFSTEPAFLQNPCYRFVPFLVKLFFQD